MVFTCCVPGCRSGYKPRKGETPVSEKATLFRFPQDEDMRQKWLRAIPREGMRLTKSHRVCSKHFYAEDITLESSDSHENRRACRTSEDLKYQRLKHGAIPRIFQALPHYLTKPPASKTIRKSHACASSRHQLEEQRLMEANVSFLEDDKVTDLADLKEKITHLCLPSDYSAIYRENVILFVCIPLSDSNMEPKIRASVTVNSSLNVIAYVESQRIPLRELCHILSDGRIGTVVELTNVLAHCKSLLETDCHSTKTKELDVAISSLKRFISDTSEDGDDGHSNDSLIQFVIEQLQLCQETLYARRYSANLIATSFIWQITSTSLYRKLSDLFILPSLGRLRQLSQGSSVGCCEVDLEYLKSRSENLSKQEKVVALMIDEVYTAQRIEYQNGKFVGLTEDGAPAKTVLTFMVQSTCSKYKDVVCVIPVFNLTSEQLHTWFLKVLKSLSGMFLVIAVSVDNHIVNRSLFKQLSGGDCIKPCIDHPFIENEKMFLFFDFTHNLKNIFNNWLKKSKMNIVTDGFEDLLGKECVAHYSHIKQLYKLEEDRAVKVAFSLNANSLNPVNISRTSPKHALSVFNESTIRGLMFYSDIHPEWRQTAKYVEFVLNIWKILSVKSPSKGVRKRDNFCDPITSPDDGSLLFLRRAANILENWRSSRLPGLTSETFLACIQSMTALPLCANHLIENHGFKYVLSGKFLSDPIEGRFGWYRQMNGGNFFMSTAQLLQSEKNIRVLSKIQQKLLSSASKLSSDSVLPLPSSSVSNEDPSWLIQEMCNASLDELSSSDANVSFFIAGYIGRSIYKSHHCLSCKNFLIAADFSHDHVADSEMTAISDDFRQIFDLANRGGLSSPTEYCFVVTAFAVMHYNFLISDTDLRRRFLTSANQRRLFVGALVTLAEKAWFSFSQTCAAGHSPFTRILELAFNCFAKNELKRLNAAVQGSETAASTRKLRKLTSKNSSS